MTSATDIHSVYTWQKRRKEELRRSNAKRLSRRDCIYGRGGALFIGMHNKLEDSSVNIYFQHLRIIKNAANVGGTASARSACR